MPHYAHPNALIDSGACIGNGSKVWAFAHILTGASIGNDCNICDHVFVENNVVIGDRVTVKCGVQLWSGVRVEDDVFIGPNATFTNDNFPRSKRHLDAYPETVLEKGCSIGANATILPGRRIGRNAMVGAGAVVTRSVPANAVVVGNPAQITGYINGPAGGKARMPVTGLSGIPEVGRRQEQLTNKSSVSGVTLHEFPVIQDLRGDLSVGEFQRAVPFTPKRYFLVFNVQNGEIRGEHAHRRCHQFLICVSGSCNAVVDDGRNREEFLLDRPNIGLYIPPMIWGTQYKYSSGSVLLVFASDYYDATDYIRDYSEFLTCLESGASTLPRADPI
ncbi:isomerase [Opitutaceae bacterium EW11]|nr:isomerase [Opitutaceae bacterium EW11]